MTPTPSICGSFLRDKRSLVAFTWTITTVLTLVAFIMATVMMIHVHTHYRRLEKYYESQQYGGYNNRYLNDGDNQRNSGDKNQQQQQQQNMGEYLWLAALSSKSMTFVAVYTMFMAISLSFFGSTAVVGFTSLRGIYIAPCFSSGGSRLRLGIFGGAIIFFANLLVVCAVVFGEVRVRHGCYIA
jgi:FtsH-binding integral membrane protein